MHDESSLKAAQKEWHGTLKAYIIGFFLALFLTLISFSLVIFKILSGLTLVLTLIALALVQASVQLLFFLHVGQEPKPRWETIAFCMTAIFVLIIVLGSIWVMNDLDERMMPSMVTSDSKG